MQFKIGLHLRQGGVIIVKEQKIKNISKDIDKAFCGHLASGESNTEITVAGMGKTTIKVENVYIPDLTYQIVLSVVLGASDEFCGKPGYDFLCGNKETSQFTVIRTGSRDFEAQAESLIKALQIHDTVKCCKFIVDDEGMLRFVVWLLRAARQTITMKDVAELLDKYHAKYEWTSDKFIRLYDEDGTYTHISIGDDKKSVSYMGRIIGDLSDLEKRL